MPSPDRKPHRRPTRIPVRDTPNPLLAAKAKLAPTSEPVARRPADHEKAAKKADPAIAQIAGATDAAAAEKKPAEKKPVEKKPAAPLLDGQGQRYITLAQLMKKLDLAPTGGGAKHLVRAGGITVNGASEERPGRKLHQGDTVVIAGKSVTVDLAG